MMKKSFFALALMLLGGSLASADILVSSRFSNDVLRYDQDTGEFLGVFASGVELANPNGMALGGDGNLYVGLGDIGSVLKYDVLTGAFLGEFVPPGTGGLGGVRDIEFGPDGDLYVASGTTNQVLRYDGVSGEFVGVAAAGNGMLGPVGLAFGPTGDLYIGAALSNLVFVFDDGIFERSFNAGGTHSNAVGLAFNANGQLLVAQSITNEVLAFEPQSGAFQGVFINGPTGTPIYMEVSPEGLLHVGSFFGNSVWRYNSLDGSLVDQLVASGSGGLNGTHDIVFTPTPDPVIVAPTTFEVTRGNYVAGGIPELSSSDNSDLSATRLATDVQSRVFVEVTGVSPMTSPTALSFTLESSVFARSTVIQSIDLWNYDSGNWEEVDSRPAMRFSDSVVIADATGDLSRFVQAGTLSLQARCRYQSINPRQQFSANIDQTTWTME